MEDDDEAESETEEDRRMPPDEALEPPHEGVGQPPSMVQINLLLQDGSIQPLIVDPDVEIYDLVYAVAHEIGTPRPCHGTIHCIPDQPPHIVAAQGRGMHSRSRPSTRTPRVEVRRLLSFVRESSANILMVTMWGGAVELLDHQRSLRQHQLPKSAMFVLKKTGIIDDHIGEDDIFDNHFLYAMVRRLVLFIKAPDLGLHPQLTRVFGRVASSVA